MDLFVTIPAFIAIILPENCSSVEGTNGHGVVYI